MSERFAPSSRRESAIAEPPDKVNRVGTAHQRARETIDKPRPLINSAKQDFAKRPILGISCPMSAKRIDEAIARISAAMARIDAAQRDMSASAQGSGDASSSKDASGSARVMALVNAHEKLREEVADTLGELDTLIEELESE